MTQEIKVNIVPIKGLFVGFIGLIIFLGGFGYWAVMTEISGAIVADGQIEVEQNRQVIQHPNGGVVASIEVYEGENVNIGDILIKLDPSINRSELIIVEGQLFELMSRRGRLEAERDSFRKIKFDPLLIFESTKNENVNDLMQGQVRLFEARKASNNREIDQMNERISYIKDQIIGIDAQKEALLIEHYLIEEELSTQNKLLDQGFSKISQVSKIKRELAQINGRLGQLSTQKAESLGSMSEIEIEILKLDTNYREKAISNLRDQQFKELELVEQQRALQDQLSRMDIRAPVSGIVYGLNVFALQSVIRPAEAIMYLIPQDKPLIITVQIDPIHIDQVNKGQNVFLRLTSLDQQSTPELTGKVAQISADAFQIDNTSLSYYRAQIILDRYQVSNLPDGVSLRPGMPVQAFIKTTDRSPILYLIKPLSDYFAKAFRET